MLVRFPGAIQIAEVFIRYVTFNRKLNDDRQGEGGTLAVINVNITITVYFVQVLFVRNLLKLCVDISVPRVGIGPTSKP